MNDAAEVSYNLGGQACRSERLKQLSILTKGPEVTRL